MFRTIIMREYRRLSIRNGVQPEVLTGLVLNKGDVVDFTVYLNEQVISAFTPTEDTTQVCQRLDRRICWRPEHKDMDVPYDGSRLARASKRHCWRRQPGALPVILATGRL